jgi:hypothetical protein
LASLVAWWLVAGRLAGLVPGPGAAGRLAWLASQAASYNKPAQSTHEANIPVIFKIFNTAVGFYNTRPSLDLLQYQARKINRCFNHTKYFTRQMKDENCQSQSLAQRLHAQLLSCRVTMQPAVLLPACELHGHPVF